MSAPAPEARAWDAQPPTPTWAILSLTVAPSLILTLATLGWNQWAGPLWTWDIPLVGIPAPLGLPLPGYLGGVILGLLWAWMADLAARP